MQYEIGIDLARQMDWLQAVLDLRINLYFELKEPEGGIELPPLPESGDTPFEKLLASMEFGWMERIVLLLALSPHVRPQMLDIFFSDNPNINRGFTEFGGLTGQKHGGFLPTAETAVFLIAGTYLPLRLEAMQLFQPENTLFRNRILDWESSPSNEPELSAAISLTPKWLHRLLWDQPYRPDFGPRFPAKAINTRLEWKDLVLAPYVRQQVMEIDQWIRHELKIQEGWGLGKWLKPGYRALFYGPPGTGKTLTASLLGKSLNRPVYRIDLSMIVSKFIGETEKNLAGVFDEAQQQDWILFFDEADALFGKRTETRSSNDRYANQEVSYLLQRIEDHPGLVILASNLKNNLDEAFIRRFQSIIHFPIPEPTQRLELWQQAFSAGLKLDKSVDLPSVSEKIEISGGEIINVLRTVAVAMAEGEENTVSDEVLMAAIRKEFQKSGRMMVNY